jgi:hypothetical protein
MPRWAHWTVFAAAVIFLLIFLFSILDGGVRVDL